MMYREGGCMDERHGPVWVVLKHDPGKQQTTVEIKDKKDGTVLTRNGMVGRRAKGHYDKLDKYFFGNE